MGVADGLRPGTGAGSPRAGGRINGLREGARFRSVRRVLEALDIVGREGEVTAKMLSGELGISLSTSYHLLGVLIGEGYVEKGIGRGAYTLGPAVRALRERACPADPGAKIEPVLGELAARTGRHAYFGLLSDGAVTVSRVEAPPGSPPVGVVRGFHGASHALALGKVLLAGTGDLTGSLAGGLSGYVDGVGLEAFTPRTIVRPDLLERHLERVRVRGFATDAEEFAENLCCVAAPVLGRGGRIEGAVGVSTTARRFAGEAASLTELVRWAAGEASAMLGGANTEKSPKK